MKYKGKTKPHALTPSEAQAIETHELYPDQRPINHARVRRYATAMQLGRWLPGSILTFWSRQMASGFWSMDGDASML